MEDKITYVQQVLKDKDRYTGMVDGQLGSKTREALATVIALPQSFVDEKKIIASIQLIANGAEVSKLLVDGLWGPNTQKAYDQLKAKDEREAAESNWRDSEILSSENEWPWEKEEDLLAYYGEVGKNQTRIQLPYPHRLSWDMEKTVNSYSCHEKVHDSLLRVLTNVYEHYGEAQIKALRLDVWGGCLNVRQIRGGTRHSTHSWGIAVDYDPSNNQLKWGSDKASFAKAEYDAWWRFWAEEGWVSLGKLKNYDWMHIQAARRV